MKNNYINVKGARENNLKNVNIKIPKDKLVVFTGVSGSGKSSLAFDTIYAEGQRRYVESLSSYARQFLGVLEKPDVDIIEGLSPSISIDQRTTSKNPRSTVGTITEIYDYLRLLYARIGHPHCPICNSEIKSQTIDQIIETMFFTFMSQKNQIHQKYAIFSPIIREKKGEYSGLLDNLKSKGFQYVRIDNRIINLSEDYSILKTNKHNIDVLIDKFVLNVSNVKRDKIYYENLKSRMQDSVNQAIQLSDGLVILSKIQDKSFEIPEFPKLFEDQLFSEKFSCSKDNIQIAQLEPKLFSFNSPTGACANCNGLGKILNIEPDLIFSDDLSIMEGGIKPFSSMNENITWYSRLILAVCDKYHIDTNIAIKDIAPNKINILVNGCGNEYFKVEGINRAGENTFITERFTGLKEELKRRYVSTSSDWIRYELEKYMTEFLCEKCLGSRLKDEALTVTIHGKNINDVCTMNIQSLLEWILSLSENKVALSEKEIEISRLIIQEIITRLKFLVSVGLNYLSLIRESGTLSSGEAQRIKLARQIGTGLSGILYVLDEPTIGLHAKDNEMLINTLFNLRDLGNTLIVVEHDYEMIKRSDYIFDFGPGAGENGGFIVGEGTPQEFINKSNTLTSQYISGKKVISFKKNENNNNKYIKIYGASQFNLKNIDISFPLNKLVVITGVSCCGISSLLVETRYPSIFKYLNPDSKIKMGAYKIHEGYQNINKVLLIDQSPIGRTPRSNPATYTKIFDLIREVFSGTKDAKYSGFNKSRFSFNLKGGRCEACEGQGQIKIEMQFLNDLWIKCDVCKGKRYNDATLNVNYNGKNISEVLDMKVDDALEYFHLYPKITNKLNTLKDVGLGYISLGQPATTLSGGEAQRVKLSLELSKTDTGHTLYILDEPTTGLHFFDIENLVKVLKHLINKGNSVFLIEHNMDVIKNADWIIDLGPEGGDAGGYLVSEGTVNEIVKDENSYTGKYLKRFI